MTITAASTGRTTSLACGLFALCLFGTVANEGTVSAFLAVGTAALFAVIVTHLTRGPSTWLGIARTLGTAVVAGLLVSAALRGVIAHLLEHEEMPLPQADVLNYATALDHMLLNVPVMATLALTIGAISIAMFRTSWTAYVGLACAVVILGAVALQVGAYAIPAALLWSLCLAVAAWRRNLD